MSAAASQAPRLVLLPDALDAEGQPRVALATSATTGRRAALVLFPTIAAALAALRDMEGRQHG
jgi:hypothetical protein